MAISQLKLEGKWQWEFAIFSRKTWIYLTYLDKANFILGTIKTYIGTYFYINMRLVRSVWLCLNILILFICCHILILLIIIYSSYILVDKKNHTIDCIIWRSNNSIILKFNLCASPPAITSLTFTYRAMISIVIPLLLFYPTIVVILCSYLPSDLVVIIM